VEVVRVPGSIRLVRGKDVWELRAYLGRDGNGKVRHRYATFHGSRHEAERALVRLVAEADRKPTPLSSDGRRWGERTTINDAIAGWRTNGWGDLSAKTTKRYDDIWRNHIRDSIGKRTIATLSSYDLECYFRDLKASGLAYGSVRQIRAVLNRACRLARKWSGATLPNPVADTELPVYKFEEQPQPVRSPTLQEVRRLLAIAEEVDFRVAVFVRLVAATGCRRGEACALCWNDIDEEHETIRITKSVISVPGGVLVKSTKTRMSQRVVTIDLDTLRMISRLRETSTRLALACGDTMTSDAFVFAAEPPGLVPPHPDSMSHGFSKVRDLAGVSSEIHLHSLRHFQATALDSVISEAQKQSRLGWSTVQMARHYTDAVPDEDRRAAQHLGRLLDGASNPEPTGELSEASSS
jgi:integrase